MRLEVRSVGRERRRRNELLEGRPACAFDIRSRMIVSSKAFRWAWKIDLRRIIPLGFDERTNISICHGQDVARGARRETQMNIFIRYKESSDAAIRSA